MPRVLRTNIRPFRKVLHECRGVGGKRVQGYALSNTKCTVCDTQIVYVWDNTPKEKLNGKKKS